MESAGKRTAKRLRREKCQRVHVLNIPMTFPYHKAEFYIRDCYSHYYDLIMSHLNSGRRRFITVTGSPGIGKSVFYIYFLQRYRSEHGRATVLASFTHQQELMKCTVLNEELDKIPSIEGAMYLYDGTPRMLPSSSSQQMVCFTSPHREWSRHVVKETAHQKLHMPIWSEWELHEASEYLGLNITRDEITRRFEVFGGVPRICLSNDLEHVAEAQLSLYECVDELGPDTVEGWLRRTCDTYQICHRIFHYHPAVVPHMSEARMYRIAICSKIVEDKLLEAIKLKQEQFSERWIRALSGIDISAGFRGCLFEIRSRNILSEGGLYDLPPLMSVEPAVGRYHRLYRMEIPPNKFIATRKGFPAIDGYYDDKQGNLHLFQQTISPRHPLKIEGIRKVMDECRGMLVEMEESARKVLDDFIDLRRSFLGINVPNNVVIVFVVPKNMDDGAFRRQRIVYEECLPIDTLVCDLVKMDGTEKTELSRLKIETIADLLRCKKFENQTQWNMVIKVARELIIDDIVNEAICNIHQYVLVTRDEIGGPPRVSLTPQSQQS